ncbi:kinesin-like protein KIF20B isoform X3 [Cyclopterus lumpus]|uniref:kinesin-like protein KIF20B isoform X3 n=1 Tax=Cyclopterus lumpus TaxID=8103 RepID=UPI001486F32C|nr:kinesin-like protein KIF20B isoform X3 [Cyclopterus lumpus]
MMESCLNNDVDRRVQIEVDDLKRDLSSEFSTLPDPQHSSIEEKEHLQVYLRIRPFSAAETNNGESQGCVTIEHPDTILLKPPSLSLSARLSADKSLPQTGQRFQFSQVYGPETMQRELFQGTVKDLVKDVLEGGNSLVFTYGVTNAGKTFTFLGPDADAGILPRSLNVIFSSIEEQVFTGMSIKPQRCREFTKLTREQQAEEVTFKRNFLSQFKQSEKSSLLNLTNKTLFEGSSMLDTTVAAEDKISLAVEAHTKFSVWVSFCEIYNENIHDLLEVIPSGAPRRTALRLSQDVKGNSFVRDLRWIQVNGAEEAYKVMKLGKKNQSFSSTRLNQLSSRSHSIFSIRILRIEDIGTPKVHAVSELCLCDLAGSERCAKTQNKGERLKEAGNINTSLLILGKCINGLRHNQQAKLLQHVPFRESKLTHYLQGFFRGRGKACMIVNINQCASMYDETLNVLKFSAVAQKVVVLSTRPPPIIIIPKRSAGDISFIINNAERKSLQSSRRTSLIGWDTSLEDVQEDEDDEYEEEMSQMEGTMDQTGNDEDTNTSDDSLLIGEQTHQRQLKQLQLQLKKERAESLLMEARLREEISREFSEIFSEMQIDYNNRLARESEILEERAERRLEIFKNLMNKMATPESSQDAQSMDTSLDSHSAEAAHACLGSVQSGAQEDEGEAGEEPERKTLELSEHQLKGQMPRKRNGENECISVLICLNGEASGLEDTAKRRLLSHPQEKLSGIARLEKQVKDLQKTRGLLNEGSSRERKQLQEAFTALEKEKRGREDTLAALEYQTMEREKALASLEEESKAKEEALATLAELKQSKEEALASLKEERDGYKKARAALEVERRAKEDAMAAHSEEKRGRLDIVAALGQERSCKEEARSALEGERNEISRLVEERETRQQESDALRQEVRELAARLQDSEHQMNSKTKGADRVLVQLQTAQAQLDQHAEEIPEKTSLIHTLTQEVQSLKRELQTAATSSDAVDHQLREEVSELRESLAEEKEKNESKDTQMLELEHQLGQTKEQLAHKWQISNQQLQQFTEERNQLEAASTRQVEELRKKLREREETSQQTLDELGFKLKCQEHANEEEVKQLRAKLEEPARASEKLAEELNEKLREREVMSQQQLEELKCKLGEQKATFGKLLDDLGLKLSEQEQSAAQLKVELEESKLKGSNNSSSSAAEEELKKLNSDLQTEIASLRSKVFNMEESTTGAQLASSEFERMRKENVNRMEELAEAAKASTELQKELLAKEAQVTSLQKSLQEAQEQREEQESHAVQEARRREVERRRELLAVAHEAIAQKDAALEKRAEEIKRLKENAKQDSDKVKSLSLDLQRKEDDTSDHREKLADYKKQIQQVQKEISGMREEEKLLRQKLADMEKAKKQLQSDVANRDRTIQQLKVEQSSDTKSDQKACKDLEAKERVLDDMRLALTEQEETQDQMEQVLEEKLNLIQELSSEVEKLKGVLLHQDRRGNGSQLGVDGPSDDLKLAKQETIRAQESLKLCAEKHQTERKKWLEEKLSLIGQAKEAEGKRNQEMRKFAEDRERYTRQQSQLESLSSQLAEKEQIMERWRKERDTLVAALEVQLQKLLSSQADKDKLIQQLHQNATQPPQETGDGEAELQAALSDREAEILRLKEELKALNAKHEETVTQIKSDVNLDTVDGKPQCETINRKSGGRKDTRASVSSQGSAGCQSVLDSSEISTENGRTRRFPRPELEIAFSSLQPNRMALRRQGEENAVTVKITRSARKRKSGEMEKATRDSFKVNEPSLLVPFGNAVTSREPVDACGRPVKPIEEVVAENRRNTRTKLTPHKEEISSPGCHDSQSSRSRKEGTLQKIGDFLQSSPTLLGTKAKKMMSLVSRRGDDSSASSSSLSLRATKNKKKLFRPEISSPMDMPSHPIISREPEEKEGDHQIIKRRLRSRMVK